MRFSQISQIVIGPARRLTLEHRILNIANFFGGFFSCLVACYNLYLGLPLVLNILCACFAIVLLTFYALGRFRFIYRPLVLPTVLTLLAVTSGTFLLNGGSHGGSQYFLFAALLSSVIITPIKYRFRIIGLYLVTVSALLLTEFTQPEFVVGYQDVFTRNMDVWISMNTALVGSALVALFIFENYRLYRRIAIIEKRRTANLLRNILPRHVTKRLLHKNESFSESISSATVLFADIVGFTPLAQQLPAEQIVDSLNHLYGEFDRWALHFGVEKVKTIGDAWMGAAGLEDSLSYHADACMSCAIAMSQVVKRFKIGNYPVRLRIGLHSGHLVAGVIGKHRIQFDLWGDTVNIASRLEEACEPGGIRWSQATQDLLIAVPPDSHALGLVAYQGVQDTISYQLNRI